MKRVVVTGAGGFIGSAAIAPLLARGFEVHTLARRLTPGTADTVIHACDLLEDDPAPLIASIAPTHLLHLAWYAEPGRFWSAPANLDWVAASLRLARAFASVGGTRLVGAGSCAEYDWTGDGTLDERATPLDPATLYGTAKAALFRILNTAAPHLGLSFGWGRIFFPYGPNEKPGRLLGSIVDAIRTGQPAALTEGTQHRDFIHVDDAGSALAALLDGAVEGAVNIGSGEAASVRKFAQTAAAAIEGAHLLRFGDRPMQVGEPPLLVATTARLRDEVGFVPRFDFVSGVAAALAGPRA